MAPIWTPAMRESIFGAAKSDRANKAAGAAATASFPNSRSERILMSSFARLKPRAPVSSPQAHFRSMRRHDETGAGTNARRPARRDRLEPRVEAHAFGTMHVLVPEERVLPAAETVERH